MCKTTNNFISAVIISKNEATIINKCLQSLIGVVDEIIVIDSFSTDNTLEICLQAGAKVLQTQWIGYAQTKNFGNKQASHDWILSIDADEVLSDELKISILELKNADSPDLFWSINRCTWYCGKWIKHGGWYPEHKLRLFDRRVCQWEGDFVHENLKVSQPNINTSKILKGDLLHYSFMTISQHIKKVDTFSTLAAQERMKNGKPTSILKITLSPLWKFISIYFLKLGCLDGFQGFAIAIISAFDKFLREAKIRQM